MTLTGQDMRIADAMPQGPGRGLVLALSAVAALGACGESLDASPMNPDTDLATERSMTMPSPIYPPARDGDIAVREEFDAAMAANTEEALRLFIARHGAHPLAAQAEARIAACFPHGDGAARAGCDAAPNQN